MLPTNFPASTPPIPVVPTTTALPAELPNSPPTLPVESFGGVSIFKPTLVEEEPSEPTSSGWDNDFETWDEEVDNSDSLNKDFEDIQL
jgi:hypothetical protein